MTRPQPVRAADVLPSSARATLRAAARRIVPDAYADAESTAEFEASLRERIAALDAHSLSQLRRALGMLGSGTSMLLTLGVPLSFDALSAEQQDSVLRSWERASIGLQRTVFQAVRRLVIGSWYVLPRAQREVGYLGPYHLRGPRFPWEGPLPGTTRDDEPVLRGAVQPQLDLPFALRGVQDARTIDMHTLSADVCVIGSGAGGGVVAARLAEAGFDVVLLEEGSYLAPAELDEDEGRMTARLYADGGARLTDDGAFGLLQGRTLGGGTTVNWMLMLEPPGHVMIVLTRDGHDTSRSNGRVRVRRDGSVSIAYTPGAHEWKLLRIGMRAAARIHLAAGAREVLTVHNEMPPLYSETDLDRIDTASMQSNRLSLFSAHVNDTCRMGTRRATSGCSPDAERWGVPGLYIADGSVLPTAPGVNPQWTIMAAATVIAARIANRQRP